MLALMGTEKREICNDMNMMNIYIDMYMYKWKENKKHKNKRKLHHEKICQFIYKKKARGTNIYIYISKILPTTALKDYWEHLSVVILCCLCVCLYYERIEEAIEGVGGG